MSLKCRNPRNTKNPKRKEKGLAMTKKRIIVIGVGMITLLGIVLFFTGNLAFSLHADKVRSESKTEAVKLSSKDAALAQVITEGVVGGLKPSFDGLGQKLDDTALTPEKFADLMKACSPTAAHGEKSAGAESTASDDSPARIAEAYAKDQAASAERQRACADKLGAARKRTQAALAQTTEALAERLEEIDDAMETVTGKPAASPSTARAKPIATPPPTDKTDKLEGVLKSAREAKTIAPPIGSERPVMR